MGDMLLLLCFSLLILEISTTVCGLSHPALRSGLKPLIPSATTYLAATPVHELNTSKQSTTFPSFRLHPRQSLTSNVTSQDGASLKYAGEYLTSFPAYVCGFDNGNPSSILTCDTRSTCAVASTRICCATNGICPIEQPYTTCQNVEITDSNDPNSGLSSFIQTSRLFCDLRQGQQCHTDRLGSTVVQTTCMTTARAVSQTIYPPQQFLDYFRGYTVEWDSDWKVLALSNSSGDPLVSFGSFRSDPPSCISKMSTICPDLSAAIQSCYNDATSETSCYCNALVAHSCPGMCSEGREPNDLLNYVVPTCEEGFSPSAAVPDNSTEVTAKNWTSSWPDYNNISHEAYINLFPWEWDLQPNTTETSNHMTNSTTRDFDDKVNQCPTVKYALISFAMVNAAVFVVSIVTANRHVTYWLSCKFFGGPEGGKWWPAAAMISVILNFAGNVINALLIKSVPGYAHVPLDQLILLWCTRPRLAWLVILLVWITGQMGNDMSTYLDSAVAALMAEVILQATGAFYMGRSVNYARVNKFYLVGHLKYTPRGSDAIIMYTGALLWITSIGMLFWAIYTFTPVGGIVKGAFLASGQLSKKYLILSVVYFWAGIRGTAMLLHWCIHWAIYCPAKTYLVRAQWPFCVQYPTDLKIDLKRWYRVRIPEQYRKQTTPDMGSSAVRKTRSLADDSSQHSLRSQKGRRQDDYYFDIYEMSNMKKTKSRESNKQETKDNAERKEEKKRVDINVYIEQMGLAHDFLGQLAKLVWYLVLPWAGQWIFWVGFIRLAQDLYCPPNVWTLAGVWSACSVVAVWLGAAL